jgi:hypothetical protein
MAKQKKEIMEEVDEEIETDEEGDDLDPAKKRGRKASNNGFEILGGKYQISSEARQWKVSTRTSSNGEVKWLPKWYVSSLSSCLRFIFEIEVRTSDYTTLQELADNVERIKNQIGEALAEAGIEPVWKE